VLVSFHDRPYGPLLVRRQRGAAGGATLPVAGSSEHPRRSFTRYEAFLIEVADQKLNPHITVKAIAGIKTF
jgi:hypothetical protein